MDNPLGPRALLAHSREEIKRGVGHGRGGKDNEDQVRGFGIYRLTESTSNHNSMNNGLGVGLVLTEIKIENPSYALQGIMPLQRNFKKVKIRLAAHQMQGRYFKS